MKQEFIGTEAFELGSDAVDNSFTQADAVVAHEQARRSLVNQAEAIEASARLKILSDERDTLRTHLGNTISHDLGGRHRVKYFLTVAVILALTGLCLAHLAFSPFGFGWYAWAFSIGLPLVCTFLTDMFLERCGNIKVLRVLVSIALLVSLTGLVILAIVRGDVLVLFVKSSMADAGSLATPADQKEVTLFYGEAARELRLFFALMAFGIEVATGLAVWEARRVVSSVEMLSRQRLFTVEAEMVRLVGRIQLLGSESDIFAHEFRRDYCRGVLHASRRHGLDRLGHLVLIASLTAFCMGQAWAQPHVVVAIDLSQSSDGHEYEENFHAASQLALKLPPGSRLDVVGITGKSFSKPVMLFSNRLPIDPGPLQFLDRIALARNRFARDIQTAGHAIKPTAVITDIFGSLAFIEDLFQQTPGSSRSLVFLSDMRQSAEPLNIERVGSVSVGRALGIVEKRHLTVALSGVDVYVLGAHADGKDVAYWRSLRDFWTAYFSKCGASVREFSLLREIPDIRARKN